MRALIERIHEVSPDDFYEKSYDGWYCVGCELFKRDNEIVDGKCVLHPTRELQWTEERNWFFRLTKYEGFLRERFAEQPDFLAPESRRNEILSLIDQGLEDISVTRSRLSWAIPFPIPTSDDVPQGTWVWFDALPNYLTATGFPESGWETRWPADLHVVGKDITRLHAVVWPAMLEAAKLPLARRVWAHGFVNLGGERFSKSAGVKLELSEAIERFGADAFRYFLMREVPFDADGNFSWERFEERYNADLANAWGNLASRTISMIEKYCDGVVPPGERRRSTAATHRTSCRITRRWTGAEDSSCTRGSRRSGAALRAATSSSTGRRRGSLRRTRRNAPSSIGPWQRWRVIWRGTACSCTRSCPRRRRRCGRHSALPNFWPASASPS